MVINKKGIENWPIIEQKGFFRFVILKVIFSSFIGTIGYTLGSAYYKNDFSFSFFNNKKYLYNYITYIILYVVISFLVGFLEWKYYKRKYDEYLINMRIEKELRKH